MSSKTGLGCLSSISNHLSLWREACRSPDTISKHFAWLLAALFGFCIFLFLLNPPRGFVPFNFLTGLVIVLLTLAHPFPSGKGDSESLNPSAVKWRIVLLITLGVSVPIMFEGINVVCRARHHMLGDDILYDSALLFLDSFLFGWLFPSGQLSLFLDKSPTVGVTTAFARLYTEVLQTLYASYYIWGNALGLWLAYKYYQASRDPSQRSDKYWRLMKVWQCAWIGTFMLNFILNLIFPAVSPRIFIAHMYENEVKGIYLADIIRGAIKSAAANSYSAFPSGHCGMSWTCALLARRMRLHQYARVTLVVAVLITIATIVLRYHYISDALGATFLLGFATWFGCMDNQAIFDKAIDFKREENECRA